jgi:hypothetical protein
LILLVCSELGYEYEEFVEIQIIKRINLELKKLDHKIYTFEREEDIFLEQSGENKEIVEA